MDMFANFATWPDGPTNENLAQYCRERLIPFRVSDDGKPYAKWGKLWLLLKCRPTASPNRYSIHMTDEE